MLDTTGKLSCIVGDWSPDGCDKTGLAPKICSHLTTHVVTVLFTLPYKIVQGPREWHFLQLNQLKPNQHINMGGHHHTLYYDYDVYTAAPSSDCD